MANGIVIFRKIRLENVEYLLIFSSERNFGPFQAPHYRVMREGTAWEPSFEKPCHGKGNSSGWSVYLEIAYHFATVTQATFSNKW